MIEDLLNCKDLYDPIEGDNAKSSDMSNADWKKLKKKTLGAIRQWVEFSLYNLLSKRQIHTLFGRTWKTCTR